MQIVKKIYLKVTNHSFIINIFKYVPNKNYFIKYILI